MHVVMLVNERINTENAVKTHVLEIFNNLTELCETSLYLPFSKVDFPQNERIMQYSRLNAPIPIIHKILLQLSQFYSLFKFCIQKRPDIMYSRFANYSFSPPIISKIFNIPLILEINGILKSEYEMKEKSRISLLVSTFFLKISELLNYSSARKIVAVTPGIRTYIQNNYQCENIEILSNGVNVDLFKPIDKSEAKKALGLLEDAKYICFVGTLYPWQGVESLILAAPSVLKRCSDTRLLIIGDGQLKKDLINLVERLGIHEQCTFTGLVPYEIIPKYINSSDICIVLKKPMESGYSPLKLYEYMSCGKPIIASNVSGFEILEQINAGLLISPDNSNDLADGIIQLLNDPERSERMGKNGREFVVKECSWKNVANRIYAFCQQATHDGI